MAILDPTRTYQAVVIGAGSGGLTAAIGLAGFGRDVVLVESGPVGGDCTNVGCVPSKALLRAARGGEDDPLAWARGRRDSLRDDEEHEMAEHEQIALVRGRARLTRRRNPHVVAVTTPDDDIVEVRAEHVVISTGSRPVRFDIPGLPDERLITNEELFELDEPPAKLAIVGGGPIGLEMATAFADLGSDVAIVELQDRLLANEPHEVSDAVRAAFETRGIAVHTGTSIERFDANARSAVLADGTKVTDVDRVLLAVGRRPSIAGLDLEAAGVAVGPRGIVADSWGRTNIDGIWAIGDVTGNTLTTHGANAVGRRTVRAIALPRLPKTGSLRAIPAAVYSRPEVASVGLSIEDLERLPAVGRRRFTVDLSELDRGHTDAIDHGVVVVDAERFTGKVLRASIVGPGAADWIGMFTMAIDHGIGLRKLFGMVHPYPAHAQAVGRIVDDFARVTYPSLPAEWWAMVRSRVTKRLRR